MIEASNKADISETEIEAILSPIKFFWNDSVSISSFSRFLSESAWEKPKHWIDTEFYAVQMSQIIGGPNDQHFRSIFYRVLLDGGWDNALSAASVKLGTESSTRPWVVLVTGLNGIRKTTSIYQPWFKTVLRQALGDAFDGPVEDMPSGSDSFFRQLDYMIPTFAFEEFLKLFTITDVPEFSIKKAEIFTKYRNLSEMLGVLLINEAKRNRMNIMIETSGKNTDMFECINHLFPDACTDKTISGDSQGTYRKLALHFSINDISFAEQSVDRRMQQEMSDGKTAIEEYTANPNVDNLRKVINANSGGPYGSSVLADVQAKSDEVWQKFDGGEYPWASSFYKASIQINAHAENGWTAEAVTPLTPSGHESPATCFPFLS